MASKDYITIRRKRYQVAYVKTMDTNGYRRLSRSCELYQVAHEISGGASDCRREHVAICYVAHGKPRGKVASRRGCWTAGHLDGDKTNTHWRNIAWQKHEDNVAAGNSARAVD